MDARLLFILVLLFASFSLPALAQEDDLSRRLDLAQQMLELRPANVQIDNAIDKYVQTLPEGERDSTRLAIQKALNYKALEKVSIDAYAEVFTAEELEAMVEYYRKPEAQSASQKAGEYAKIVYPEIIAMLDKALMRVKTEKKTP